MNHAVVKSLILLLCLLPSVVFAADIWLFRHGEKAQGSDPELTQAGHERAQRIAAIIQAASAADAPLWLYSTDFKRTGQTIAPLAEASGMEVKLYNPRQLAQFANEIGQLQGTVVVAGHSNTTPALLKLLSGIERQISEDKFDALYHLQTGADGVKFEELSSNLR